MVLEPERVLKEKVRGGGSLAHVFDNLWLFVGEGW